MPVSFQSADINFILKGKGVWRKWIISEVYRESFRVGKICFIFCSDEYLLDINRRYLNHDYYTDIITFNYNKNNELSGDLFISVDRVTENAATFGTDYTHELNRVMIHGILHLLGYDDATPDLKKKMRLLEDEALSRSPKS